MNTITTAIAEDHKVFRKGIILSMQPYKHIRFIAEAGNGTELIERICGNTLPDIVLMDIRMPGMDGIETTKYLTAHYPEVRIICLTMFEDREFVEEMLKSGASGYLLKNADPSVINRAMQDVVSKGYFENLYTQGVFSK